MRLDIKNSTSHSDAPIHEMWNLLGVTLYHFCWRWPGSSTVVRDLKKQNFYLELIDDFPTDQGLDGVLGYHSIDNEGKPYSQVAINPSLQHGSDWLLGQFSVQSVLEHEALETIANPILNVWRDSEPGVEVAQEVGDPVQDSQWHHRGADHSNFVLPSYFNPFGVAPYDYLGVLERPFTRTEGGYIIMRAIADEGNARRGQVDYGEHVPDWRKHGSRTTRLAT